MKNIFFLFLLALSLNGMAQTVTADPAVGSLSITDNTTNLDRSSTVSNLPVRLKLPVFNFSPFNPIPNGSTTINIGLGSKLALAPGFNLATARLSNYFSFVYNTSGSQPRIIGTQIAAIPKDFIDSTEFQVIGTSLGISAASANFSINPGGSVDDEDGNNNSTSLTYNVIAVTLPVKLTQFNVVKTGCNIDVSFATAEEDNVSRFEVEVSKNGSDFTKIGEISARNASKYSASYAITDAIKSATLYVRLKSVDKDAKYEYSSVQRIMGTCENKRAFVLGVFPNPIKVGRNLTVTAREGNFDGKYSVSLLDVSGRTLLTKELQLNNVSNFKFDIGHINAGQYLLRVTNTDLLESAVIGFQKH